MNLGHTVYAGVLPDPSGKPSSADRQAAGLYCEVLRRDPPGAWSSNRYLQSQQYVGTQYVAIKATWSWLAGSTVIVERERQAPVNKGRIRKATQPGGLGNDDRYHPVDTSDPLAQLFEHVNDADTFQDFIAQLVIQVMLTGNAHIWLPRNEEGRPSEMWVLPSVMLQQLPGGFSAAYPFGGYRVNPSYGYGWGGIGIPAIGNVPLDKREVVHYREPHALFRWDGYGATQAMAKQIDVLNGVETARVSSMERGVNISGIAAVDGISQDQADELSAKINKNYAGANNAGKVWVADGTQVKFTPTTGAPKDLDMPAGWEQSGRAVLAGYRIPPVVAGIIEANYAEFWAAVRAWFAGELRPFATRLGATLTKHVARPAYGRDYRVRLQLPAIDDPDMLIKQHEFSPNDLFTVNEHRAAFDAPAVEGGDVPLSVYTAQQNQALGLGPDGQPIQGGGQGDAVGDMSSHPLNALGDGILDALGVDAGHPGSDPLGDDDPDDGDDADTDTDSPFTRGRKAFGANRFEEGKHKRDAGKFSSTGGAGKGSQGAGRPAQLSPQAARHPAVVQALRALASNAAAIGQRVNAAMLGANLTPADLVGSQSQWETYFLTQHTDAVASATGLDTQTAAAVLSHLVAHGVQAIKRQLRGGPEQGADHRPGVARPAPNGDTMSVPRPDNPHGKGSLPNRVKSFPAEGCPELDAFLETLV